MIFLFRFLFLLLFLNFSYQGFTQIVRIEGSQIPQDSSRLKGVFEFNLYTIKNNTTLFRLGSGSQIEYEVGKHKILSINELRLILSRGNDLENRGFQHFRYQRELKTFLTLELFTQIQFDEVLKIRMRQLNGIGPRFQLYKKKKDKIFFGLHYMYEYEEELDTELINRDHRLSSHVTVTKQFDRSAIDAIVYFQPRLDLFSDYRVSGSASYTIELRKQLLFTLRGEIAHDTNPVEGVTQLTYTIVNGFNLTF